MLNHRSIPIHQPGLQEVVSRRSKTGRLQFTTDEAAAVAHGRVPGGTAGKLRAAVPKALAEHGLVATELSAASKREFLKGSDKVEDVLRLDCLIVGAENERAHQRIWALNVPFH